MSTSRKRAPSALAKRLAVVTTTIVLPSGYKLRIQHRIPEADAQKLWLALQPSETKL